MERRVQVESIVLQNKIRLFTDFHMYVCSAVNGGPANVPQHCKILRSTIFSHGPAHSIPPRHACTVFHPFFVDGGGKLECAHHHSSSTSSIFDQLIEYQYITRYHFPETSIDHAAALLHFKTVATTQ
jgi:hypothetical protein